MCEEPPPDVCCLVYVRRWCVCRVLCFVLEVRVGRRSASPHNRTLFCCGADLKAITNAGAQQAKFESKSKTGWGFNIIGWRHLSTKRRAACAATFPRSTGQIPGAEAPNRETVVLAARGQGVQQGQGGASKNN